MLALDSTIGCLEASEGEVLDLYRSAPISLCPSPGTHAESTEAYLCAIKKKTLVKVYLAFVVNDSKIYVYTSPGKGKSEQEYPDQIDQALGQVRAMGFSPDRVALSYSPAMREVVVRNTKILRLPGTKAKSGLKHGLPGAPVIPLIPQPPPTPLAAEAASPPDTGAANTESAELRRSLNELKKRHQAVLTERDGLEERFSQLAAKHEEVAGELSCLKGRCSELCAENESLAASRAQSEALLPVREQLTEAQEQIAAMGRQLEALATERERSAGECEAMVENLARARQDLAQLTAERDAALENASRLTEQNLATDRELKAAHREREEALRRLSDLEQENNRQEEQLAALRRQSAESDSEREALQQRLAALEEQKGPDCAAVVEVRRELEQVTSEQDALEPPRSDSAATLPPFHELELPYHLGQPWLTGEATEASAPTEEEGTGFPSFGDLGSSFVPLGELQGDAAFGHDEDAPVRFLLETGLAAIECPEQEEVLELYHSINNAYLSPEGTGGQESCQGYICCLGKGDRKEVFAAIYGMSSRRTWVYLPETQPQDEEGYGRTRRSAISFAEEVGLMMEEVPLEAAGPKRQERLGQCPVLRMIGKN